MPRSFGACGQLMTTGDSVSMRAADDGRVMFKGLATCGLTWECPCCGMTIKARRADQIRELVEWHGRDGVQLLTLTFRHGLGDDLRKARQGLADAWRGMARGAPWAKFKRAIGYVGTVRALEVTHGPNGWHPHLHVLILARPDWHLATMPDGEPVADWLQARWSDMVCRYLGEKHEPDEEHGTDLSPCSAGDYLQKLGLEVSDPGKKVARLDGNRTPLELAAAIVEHRKPRDVALWRTYCLAMRGARQLTWSKGLRELAGIPDKTDQELAEDEEAGQPTTKVLTISGADWRAIARYRVEVRRPDNTTEQIPAPLVLAEKAERSGARGAWSLLRSLVRQAKADKERRGREKRCPTESKHRSKPVTSAGETTR
jgi:hypothetical protein